MWLISGRDAFWTYLLVFTLKFPLVPAFCTGLLSAVTHTALVSLFADVHARRYLVDPTSSLWCLRFGPHFRLKTPSLR